MAQILTHETDFPHTPTGTQIPQSLREIRSLIWFRDFVIDWTIIVAAFVIFAALHSPFNWLALPLIILIIGARQHALGLLAHDAVHRLAFRNRTLNMIVAEVFIAWPLFIVLKNGYQPWHFDHDRGLGSDHDPEIDYRGGRPYSGRVTWRKIMRCFVLDLMGCGSLDLLNFMRLILPYKHFVMLLGPIAMWLTAVALLSHFNALWILALWTASELTAFWAVFRIRAWTEHVSVPLAGKESSHRFDAGPIARFFFFPHHTYCHYEHHKWPQIPYYNLPELRKLDTSKPVLCLRELFPIA